VGATASRVMGYGAVAVPGPMLAAESQRTTACVQWPVCQWQRGRGRPDLLVSGAAWCPKRFRGRARKGSERLKHRPKYVNSPYREPV
jgi:hypothetical protein